MSIRVMSAVWEIALPDSEKLIALALADWCDDDGKCWPSVAQIAAKCSKSVRTVQGALISLEGKGLLRRDMIAGKGTIYHLTPAAAAPRKDRTPAETAPPQGTTQTPAAAAPNTSITTISSEANASSDKRACKSKFVLPSHIPAEQWQAYEEMRRRIRKPMTDRARSLAVQKLDELASAGWPPGDVLDQSVMNSWQGLFGIRDGRNGTGNQAGRRNQTDNRDGLARALDRSLGLDPADRYATGTGGGDCGFPPARLASM